MYSRSIDGRTLSFGVSGLLYKSNVLMYDRQTESLWSQVKNQAVTGPMTGTRLEILPSTLTTWEKWRAKHPNTEVLSPETGYSRDYSSDPYADYYENRSGLFGFFKGLVSDYPGKELVAGVKLDGEARAYPLDELRELERLEDRLGERTLSFDFDPVTGKLNIKDQKGERVSYITTYWFVWKEIHPESALYSPED